MRFQGGETARFASVFTAKFSITYQPSEFLVPDYQLFSSSRFES